MFVLPDTTQKGSSKIDLKVLQHFAQFLLDKHFDDFLKVSMQLLRELNVPLLNLLGEEEAEKLGNNSNTELLLYLAQNNSAAHIEKTIERWKLNQLPKVKRNQIVVDDITRIGHWRKLAFLKFLPAYTSDSEKVIELIKEIDLYLLEYSSSAFKSFVTIIDDRLHEHIQRLQESETLFKQAQRQTHIGNYVWDLLSDKLTWSDELYRIHELDPGVEVTNDMVVRFTHPEDVDLVQSHLHQAKETSQEFEFYYRIILSDGRIKTLHAQGQIIKNDQGQHAKMFGTAQDVTDRHNLIEKLQTSENRYKQAETIAHIGNWSWDVKKNKVTWTDEMFRMFGLEPQSEEITYEKYLAYIYPDDQEMLTGIIAQSLQTKLPYEFYHRVINKDGKIKILHARGEALTNQQGDIYELIGSAQDVTAQKLIEKKLLDNQNFLQKIADATPAIIASYNIVTGKYSFISQGLSKLLGYDPHIAMDEGVNFFLQLIHPDDLNAVLKKNSDALQRANQHAEHGFEYIVEFQYRMKHQNGDYQWFHTFGTVFDRNHQGDVENVLNISLDVTERIKAEDILMQRTHELQQSNASLEEFAYVASHDLKEPLRKISIFASRLADVKYLDADRQNVEKIINGSVRMQRMIDDLLSLSLISATVTKEYVNLEKLLREVLSTFEHKIEERKAKIISDELPYAYVIPSQMRQLFQNLVSNSLKFAQENISPVIRVSHQYVLPDEVKSHTLPPADRYLQMQFTDNGIGFEKEFSEKIFAVFQRLHHKHEYEGTGIGLAICRKIVKNNGGTIVASAAPNAGAVFTIILPA